MALILVVAAVGAVLVAVGFGMWVAVPLGLIVGGVELLAGAYAAGYLKAKGGRA